ncbi:MAG: hypothetical protein WA919_02050 [Coleofasciculaceae cyanobacterium]
MFNQLHQEVECPKCGKKTVVQTKENLYQCISCNFERDFSEVDRRLESDHSFFWAGAVAALFAFLILQVVRYTSTLNPTNFEYQSSPAPESVQARTE